MRINDFHNILELIKQDILQSEAEYLKLLKVVGNNQKYDFRSQLSIYDKNPEATACAKFDYWRERFGRTVMRGQKGIPILEDYGTYKKVDYIFDISQTVSKNRDVNEVNLWRFDKEAHRDVLKEMIKAEGYEESESTLENIFSLSRLYGDEKIDSLMNELRISDEDRVSFTKFARDSVSYAVASRFKLDYPMDKELLKRLLSYGEEREIAVGLTIDDKDYFVNPAEVERIDKIRWGESMRDFQDPWKMLELPVRTLAYIGEAGPVSDLEAHFPELKFPLFSSRLGADIIEIQASKANGLVRLCEYYGMDISQTVAFGDSMNDYEIVQAAGTGIAMGNSVQKLKDAADYVTDDIARDGVWKACRHFGWI